MPCDNTVWWQYEQVAMHFNQLIIQFRTQALGGVVAAVVAGGVLAGKEADAADRNRVRRHFFGFLLFAWTAAAFLDALYYQQLLRGAVDALITYEKGCPFQLSTQIENHFDSHPRLFEHWAAVWYYGILWVPLFLYVAPNWVKSASTQLVRFWEWIEARRLGSPEAPG
jgi:hypothetical protein